MKILCYLPAVLAVFFVALAVYPTLGTILSISDAKTGVIVVTTMCVWAVNMFVYIKRKVA